MFTAVTPQDSMLPVTRVNLDNFCCTCLVNVSKQKAYDIKKESNLLNMLKLTAYIDVVKDPSNLKYVNEYCKKVCDVCFLNVKKAFQFREKFIASIDKLKELLKSKTNAGVKYFCCICLNRQHFVGNYEQINNTNLKLLESCLGLMRDVTNEVDLKSEKLLLKQLCNTCLEELKNIKELQLLSKCSYEHIVSEFSNTYNEFTTNSVSLKGKTNDILTHEETAIIYDKTLSTYDSKEIFMVNCDDNSQYRKTSYNASLQKNVLEGPEDTEGTNILINKDHSAVLLKTCADNKNVSEIIKANNEVFVIKYEKENTEYNEPIYNNVTLQKNIVSNHLQSEENNIDGLNILVNKQDCNVAFEKDDNKEKDYEVDIVDANEDIKVPEYRLPKLADIPIHIKTESNFEAMETQLISPSLAEENNVNGIPNEFTEKTNDYELSDDSSKQSLNSSENSFEANKGKSGKILHCKDCNKYFSKDIHLEAHIRAAHTAPKTAFECSVCNKDFTRLHLLTDHMKLKHKEEIIEDHIESSPENQLELSNFCHICRRNYSSKRALKDHIKRHKKIKEHVCQECGIAKVTRTELVTHMRTHTPNLEKFPCPLCPQLFNHKNAISRHVKVVHEGLKRYQCTYCPERFATRYSQVGHERLHTGEKPFMCKICNKVYAQQKDLKFHMKSHDKKNNEQRHLSDKSHICNICSKNFAKSEEFRIHLFAHFEVGTDEDPETISNTAVGV